MYVQRNIEAHSSTVVAVEEQ